MQDIDTNKIVTSFENLLDDKQVLFAVLLVGCLLLLLVEGYKFLRYKTRSDILDLSFLGVIFFSTLIPFDDLFLSGLAVVFALMTIGTYELRESQIWVRLMAAFTIAYGYLLVAVFLARVLDFLFTESILTQPSWLNNTDQLPGFAWSTMIWLLLILSFAFFGRRFILVSRFLSPQYVYMFLYAIVYIIILQSGLPLAYRYVGLFVANSIIYLNSGWLLGLIFGIKPLEDERALRLVDEVQGKIGTKIRSVGIVKAPILNAFAYGPFFDQRFAFIVKDINNFSDEELVGIAAHEMAHLKYKHTLMLLFVGFIDLTVRWLLDVPASTYDFAVGINQGWSLAQYFAVNMLFFAIALIFVRLMEGQADRLTRNAGYGNELVKALYRLEGFYRGIAGEIGLNAQLLTDSERTNAEERRFTGEAASEIYHRLMKPSRYGLVMNLIVSHPPTQVRMAAVVSGKFSPLRIALMPILLLLPGTRKRNLQILQSQEPIIAGLLSEKYRQEFESVENYLKATYVDNLVQRYVGRGVLLLPKYEMGSEEISGQILEVKASDQITNPVTYVVKTEEGTTEVLAGNYDLLLYEPNNYYLLKDRRVGVLRRHVKQKKKTKFVYDVGGKEVESKQLGMPLTDFLNADFVYQSRGKSRVLNLTQLAGQPVKPFAEPLFEDMDSVSVSFEEESGDVIQSKVADLAFQISPVVIVLYKRFKDENLAFIKALINRGVELTLYTSKDPDIGVPCRFVSTRVEGDEVIVEYLSPDEEGVVDVKLRQIDAVVLRRPWIMVNPRKEIGFFTKLYMRVTDRTGQVEYIV